MALVFHGRLALPLWAVGLFAVALTAPAPTSLLVALGIMLIAFATPGLVPGLRTSPSIVRIPSGGQRESRHGLSVVACTCVHALDRPKRITAEDALALVRMDDDGGWQMGARGSSTTRAARATPTLSSDAALRARS